MKPPAFHAEFRLNGQHFSSVTELLQYAGKQLSDDHTAFLHQWFDDSPDFEVQTSGSTGKPKTYRFAKQTAVAVARRSIDFFGLPPASKVLLVLSSGYIAGKMMWVRALTGGWHLDVVPARKTIEFPQKNYDFGAMVPYQAYANREQIERFGTLILGGAPVGDEFVKAVKQTGTRLFLTYGMTETLTHVAVRALNPAAAKTIDARDMDVYHALPGVRFQSDENGRLIVHDPLTSKAPLHTRDLVEWISPTRFRWLGRADNVINSGGHKVIPEQVEKLLAPHIHRPFYLAGLSDEKLGQKVVLVVEGQRSEQLEENIRQAVERVGLHPYDRPKDIVFVPQFHRTRSGKIIRDFGKREGV